MMEPTETFQNPKIDRKEKHRLILACLVSPAQDPASDLIHTRFDHFNR